MNEYQKLAYRTPSRGIRTPSHKYRHTERGDGQDFSVLVTVEVDPETIRGTGNRGQWHCSVMPLVKGNHRQRVSRWSKGQLQAALEVLGFNLEGVGEGGRRAPPQTRVP